MRLRRRRAEKREAESLLKESQETLAEAHKERIEQERRLEQERESVISRIDRIKEQNNIAQLIRQALQQHGGTA